MVKLRLTRLGKTHAPFYRIVAIDNRKSRDGQCLEVLGHYDPTKEPKIVKINAERTKYWLSVGAIPTETVRSLIMKNTDIELKAKVIKKSKQVNIEEPKKEESKAETTVKEETKEEETATEEIAE